MDADDAVRLRRTIQRLARHFNTSATDEGLTPTQASVLALVFGRGPIRLTELVQLEHINPTMLSRVVGKLDEDGLVARIPDPDDLRSASLQVTPAGRKVHERIKAQRGAAVTAAAAQLSPDEHAALVAALDSLEQLERLLR